ncbi:hypothetical protein, partial [uncultured Helicobacter sp.]|uniref:beta strand repeat-containing protein n=1 Tax=uncultured Helicobacter sp. TaxID=175537 RepID=UPI0026178A20
MASSLAMALGVSVASGTPITCTNSNGELGICADSKDIYSSVGFIWNGVGGTDVYQPALSSGTTPIEKLTFKFSGSNTSHTGDQNNFTVSILNTSTTLTIAGNGKSLQMGQGSGELIFDFESNSSKTVNLNLDSISTTNHAIKGNLAVMGEGSSNNFSATLGGKGVSGWTDITSNGTTQIVYTDVVEGGHIWGRKGTNTFTFNKNATLSSGSEVIYGGFYSNGYQAKNTFTFNGETNTIKSASGTAGIAIWINGNNGSNLQNTFNSLTFKKGTNTIIGQIIATSNNNRGDRSIGKNKLLFETSTATNTIQGKIQASCKSENEITIGGSVKNEIQGQILSDGGTNTIIFNGSGNATIQGNINSFATGTGLKSTNIISFSSSGTNTINGSVTARPWNNANGSNALSFTHGTNIINGNIVTEVYGSGGTPTNTIKTETSSASLTINGSIIANAGGNNTLTLDVGNNTITAPTQTRETAYALNANGGTNTVTFSGSGNSSITGNINASGTNTLNNSLNAITFSSTGTNTIAGNITASTFNAADSRSATGKNTFKFTAGTSTITGNISSIIGENTFAFSGSSTGTFSGNLENNAGTLKIDNTDSGAISINGVDTIIRTYGGGSANTTIQSVGALTINVKSIEVTNAGYGNNVNTIIATNAGLNTITGDITTSGGITNIAINGDSSNTTSSSLSSNITNNGSTNIILQDSTWASSSLKKTIDTPTNSGTLTNNSGTTNLVI